MDESVDAQTREAISISAGDGDGNKSDLVSDCSRKCNPVDSVDPNNITASGVGEVHEFKDAISVNGAGDHKQDDQTEVSGNDHMTSLHNKIVKQIEYYFGDINLIRDKFLLEMITKDDGWVPLQTMLTFNRLRSLTDQSSVIVDALKNSEHDLIEVNEEGDKIRRSPRHKLPENTKEHRDEVNNRSIYAKGFPLDSTLDDLKVYFDETHGPTDQVFLRTYGVKDYRKFKGSVFVTFKLRSDAEAFMKAESVTYKGEELIRNYKQAYYDSKRLKYDEKKKPKKPQQVQADKKPASQEAEPQIVPGAVLHITGLPETTNLEDVKTFFNDISVVAWVDLSTKKTEAWVRFREGVAETTLQKAKEAATDGRIEINGSEIQANVLQGEEEQSFWKKLIYLLQNRAGKKGKGGKRGQKPRKPFTRSNKHKKFHGTNNDSDADAQEEKDEPAAKVAKMTESTETN